MTLQPKLDFRCVLLPFHPFSTPRWHLTMPQILTGLLSGDALKPVYEAKSKPFAPAQLLTAVSQLLNNIPPATT